MRIVVNDIAATSGGPLTVLEGLHHYVRDFDGRNHWIFLVGGEHLLEESEHIKVIALPAVKNRWLRRLWFDAASGRFFIRSLKPDVVLSLQNTYTLGVGCAQVVYVHQSLPFQRELSFSMWRRDERLLAVYQHFIGGIIKESIRRATHVVVQTQWLRDAIVAEVGISPRKIDCFPPDLEDLGAYKSEPSAEAATFFYPTTEHAYKNIRCIYEACSLLRQEGVHNFAVTITTRTEPNVPNVHAIGALSRAQTLGILSRSTLVYPSLVESYGLPLAEARSLGALVLAADRPYAREVLDGYENAHFFDPLSPSQLATLMRSVITGQLVRSEPVRNAREPDQVARIAAWANVVELIERLAKGGGSRR